MARIVRTGKYIIIEDGGKVLKLRRSEVKEIRKIGREPTVYRIELVDGSVLTFSECTGIFIFGHSSSRVLPPI